MRRRPTSANPGVPDTIEKYARCGNSRPPADRLRSFRVALHNTPSGLEQIVLADVYIDLAMCSLGQDEQYMRRAKGALNAYIQYAEARERCGDIRSFPRILPLLTRAYIRRAQLPAWQSAAKGEAPTQDYDTLLTALSDAVSLSMLEGRVSHLVEGYTREAVPVLLGARGRLRGTQGWLGRTTLYREACNIGDSATRQRWNTGFCLSETALAFDRPEVVVDTTARRPGPVKRREPGPGVMQMRASTYGFANPAPVIWGCVMEQDGVVPEEVRSMPLLDSTRLDEMAQKMWNAVTEYRNVQA